MSEETTPATASPAPDAGQRLEDLRAILAGSGMGTWRIELPVGREPRMSVDPVMAGLMGLGPGDGDSPEAVYRFWHSRVKPEAMASVEASVARLMGGAVDENTYLWSHPRLGDRYVRCGGSGRAVPGGGHVLLGYHYDVTAQMAAREAAERKARRAMAELEENYQIIRSLVSVYDTIYYIDTRGGRYTELGVRLPGVREAVGRSGDMRARVDEVCRRFVASEHQDAMRQFMDLDKVAGRLTGRDRVSMPFLGQYHGWSEASFIAGDRDRDGACRHVFFVTRDINEQKQQELAQQRALEAARDEAQRASRAKTRFLLSMSHDIRTPMNAVMGFTDLLERHQHEPERRADYLRKIRDSTAVLLSLVNNVLEMSHIEGGRVELNEEPWSVGRVRDTISSVFHDLMEQKGLRFECRAEVRDDYVYCDPTKLREVFINLVSNAYKYTPPGGRVTMTIRQLPDRADGARAVYETRVEDTGMGISPEFVPHLFEEFVREYDTTQLKIEGTGLGLPIVKRLLDLMGGTIEVESEKGRGSVFTVRVPLRRATRDDLRHPAAGVPAPGDFRDRRILLAEDNALNAEIATEVLRAAGFEVECAADGRACLSMVAAARAGHYDAVLMDIQMPVMNGYDATRAIRSLPDRAKAQVPILAMTANAFGEDRRRAAAAGMDAHLAKPVDVGELLRALSRVLG